MTPKLPVSRSSVMSNTLYFPEHTYNDLRCFQVNDYWLNITQVGFCNSKLINSSVSVQFLGTSPQQYKPGMPFKGQVLLSGSVFYTTVATAL